MLVPVRDRKDAKYILEKISDFPHIISIDIPSGIYADSGNQSNISVNSMQTVTFTYPKIGHYISQGYKSRGDLYVYPIGHSENTIKSRVNSSDKL